MTNSALLQELPAPQRLALAYASHRARPATLALLALDARLAAILRGRREPLAAQLRLAWWRDTLARPASEWPQGEPALDALHAWRDPSRLARLVEGWEALLADELSADVLADFVSGRAGAFDSLARELGAAAPGDAFDAAGIWALADLAANVSDAAERRLIVEYGRARLPPPRLPASLRPLAVLAGLSEKALRRGGAPLLARPGDTFIALRIGLSGR